MRLAVFDLDGTITRHDTLVPYLIGFLNRHPWRWPRVLSIVPALLRYAFKRDRGGLKSALLRATLRGVSRPQLDEWNAHFVPRLIARGTFKQALEQIDTHRRANDKLVLMSASVDLYVPQIARELEFTETICTGVLWKGDRLEGSLTTPNRRGAEKTRCLDSLRSRHPGLEITAYGNAASDLDHLARATHGVLINGAASARRQAIKMAIHCVTWT